MVCSVGSRLTVNLDPDPGFFEDQCKILQLKKVFFILIKNGMTTRIYFLASGLPSRRVSLQLSKESIQHQNIKTPHFLTRNLLSLCFAMDTHNRAIRRQGPRKRKTKMKALFILLDHKMGT